MKKKNLFLITILAAFIVAAFTSTGFQLKPVDSNSPDAVLVETPDDPADAKYPKGAKIYKEKCFICHQANGEGIPGAFPPLKNSDYLFADKVRAVAQTLNGSHEEMVVNGVTYTAPMTPQVDNKEDAVAVINYVLNAWGNDGGTVSMEDVKGVKIAPR